MINHLGLLGLGSRSTAFYIEQLNRVYNKAHGGYSTCPLILLNSDFNDFNPYLPDQYPVLETALRRYLRSLSQLGVQQLIIPNITLHESYDRLKGNSKAGIELIHPVTTTLEKMHHNKLTKVVLIGSKYTMLSKALSAKFTLHDIEVVRPSHNDCETIDTLRQRIYTSEESVEDIANFRDLLEHYEQQAPIVIACTELSIACHIGQHSTRYDMADVQITHALRALANAN
jgi:aspartate racemase